MKLLRDWTRIVVAILFCATTADAQVANMAQGFIAGPDSVRIAAMNTLLEAANGGMPYDGYGPRHIRAADLARTSDSLVVALIATLELENRRSGRASNEHRPEEWGEYYVSLVACVAALRDIRAVDALLGAMIVGAIPENGVVALGEAALPRVLQATESADHSLRHSALHALKAITRAGAINQPARREFTSVFLKALDDEHPMNRLSAISALSHVSDTTTHMDLERLSRNDPYRVVLEGQEVYPVRRAAEALLRSRRAK